MNGGEAEHFHLAFSVGSYHDRRISHFFIKQRPAYWRSGRNLPGIHVRFFAGHQLVFHFFIFNIVIHAHRGSQSDLVFRNIVHVDKGEIGQPPAQLSQPCLNKLLPLFGHVILSVFAEISQGDGLLELRGKLMAQLVFANVELFFTVAVTEPFAKRAEISSPTLTCAAFLRRLPRESKTSAYPRSRIATGDNA